MHKSSKNWSQLGFVTTYPTQCVSISPLVNSWNFNLDSGSQIIWIWVHLMWNVWEMTDCFICENVLFQVCLVTRFLDSADHRKGKWHLFYLFTSCTFCFMYVCPPVSSLRKRKTSELFILWFWKAPADVLKWAVRGSDELIYQR